MRFERTGCAALFSFVSLAACVSTSGEGGPLSEDGGGEDPAGGVVRASVAVPPACDVPAWPEWVPEQDELEWDDYKTYRPLLQIVMQAEISVCSGCHAAPTAGQAMCNMCWGSCESPKEAIKTLAFRDHRIPALIDSCYSADRDRLRGKMGNHGGGGEPRFFFRRPEGDDVREAIRKDVGVFLAGATGEQILEDHETAMIEWVEDGAPLPERALHEVILEALNRDVPAP